MAAKLLTDRAVQNAKPKSKPYRLADGDSLDLLVSPTGSKSWQLRYRHNGVPQTASLGKLELVGLAEARKVAPHSWRSAFKTVCSEAGKERDVVESQLDHQAGNKVESAYDRAKRLDLRRELMTWYEATLIAARDGARVVPLQRHA